MSIWLGVTPYLTEEAVVRDAQRARALARRERKSCSTTPTRPIGSRTLRRALIMSRWLSGSRRAASRSGAISIQQNCTLTRANLGSRRIEDLDRAALVARYLPDLPGRSSARARRTCRPDGDGVATTPLSLGERVVRVSGEGRSHRGRPHPASFARHLLPEGEGKARPPDRNFLQEKRPRSERGLA